MTGIKGKKVLVTGADGFIGSHLTERLIEEGCEVKAFTCYNFSNSWGWLDTVEKEKLKEAKIHTGDVRDIDSVRRAMEGVDIVFHLAALIGIPYSYHAPYSYVETNINGTLNVIQAARAANVGRVLVTSTSEVYGSALYVPIDEKHPKQGQSPYSASKIGADHMAESFYKSFGLPVVIVRPFNTYGPRQSARAIIPTVITQLLSGLKEVRLGALEPTRDLVYVSDVADAFLKLAICDKAVGEEVNISTQKDISIGDLARLIIKLIDTKAKIVSDPERLRPKSSEVQRLCGCNKKILALTGWKPEHSLEDGLHKTIAWFKKNTGSYKPEIYNV